MRNRKQFVGGFTGSVVVFAVLSLLPLPRWFLLDNAIRTIGFPFTFAYVGEFGGPYHFLVLAAGVDSVLGLALALLGGYLWAKSGRKTVA